MKVNNVKDDMSPSELSLLAAIQEWNSEFCPIDVESSKRSCNSSNYSARASPHMKKMMRYVSVARQVDDEVSFLSSSTDSGSSPTKTGPYKENVKEVNENSMDESKSFVLSKNSTEEIDKSSDVTVVMKYTSASECENNEVNVARTAVPQDFEANSSMETQDLSKIQKVLEDDNLLNEKPFLLKDKNDSSHIGSLDGNQKQFSTPDNTKILRQKQSQVYKIHKRKRRQQELKLERRKLLERLSQIESELQNEGVENTISEINKPCHVDICKETSIEATLFWEASAALGLSREKAESSFLSTIQKMVHVIMNHLPRLESFVDKVCANVLNDDQNKNWKEIKSKRKKLERMKAVLQKLDEKSQNKVDRDFRDKVSLHLAKRGRLWSHEELILSSEGLYSSFEPILPSSQASAFTEEEIFCAISELVQFERCFMNYPLGDSNEAASTCPQTIVSHFMQLFGLKNYSHIFPKMNELYVFSSEMRNVLRNLRGVLRIKKQASVQCVARRALEELKEMDFGEIDNT